MSTLFAIAAFEARHRWWVAAAALPFAAAATALGPGRAGLLAVLYGGTAGALAGARLLARDLATGRIAFLLTLPARTLTVYTAKLLAACGPIALGIALIFAPAALRAPASSLPPDLARALAAALLALLSANVVAIALLTRTGWLVVDAVLGALTAVPLALAAPRLTAASALAFGGAAVAATFLAGLAALGGGRTNPLRAHGALSLTLWAILLPSAFSLLASTR